MIGFIDKVIKTILNSHDPWHFKAVIEKEYTKKTNRDVFNTIS